MHGALRAAVVATLFNAAPALSAAPPEPDRWEGYREEMRTAAVHVQAEIVSAVIPFAASDAPCTADAVARRVFRGGGMLPEGTRFRVRMGCSGRVGPELDRWMAFASLRDLSKPKEGRAVWPQDLSQGRLIEIYMDPAPNGPPNAFVRAGDAVLPLDRVTDRALLPVPPAPAGSHAATIREQPHLRPAPPAVPLFPTRDVTVTFRSSLVPEAELRARYDAAGWRVRTDYPGNVWGGVLITDAFARSIIRTDPGRSEFAAEYVANDTVGNRLGRLSRSDRPILTTQGEDTVAGLRCTVYVVRSELPSEPEALACVTPDGVQLRRSDTMGEMEVTSVRYATSSPGDFGVPPGYSELRHLR